jgi:hypothetical protein
VIGFNSLLLAAVVASQSIYTLPQDVPWHALVVKGVPAGAQEAFLRGKAQDRCDVLVRNKFPNGFVYPWHVNNVYGIYTVLSGTLVLGFDKNHARAKERVLPTGTVLQGLATEPHYGRAVGDTIFDVYLPCKK